MRIKELVCVFITIFLNCYTTTGVVKNISLRMPGVRPKKNDSYVCMSLKLSPGNLFIVKYEPEAHKETAHHMLLFGCQLPGRSGDSPWNCGDMGAGTCRGSESILFGWARDAPSLQLPKDVGFKVGGSTDIQYLTLQIHYAHALEAGHYDRSGLTLHMTTTPQPNLASIYLLLASSAYIPPHSKGVHVDIACEYNSEQEITAFAFRTHAHDLGRVITAYRVRNDSWKLLGKGDPHAPQAFYPMDDVTTIKKGDILAARCTYDSVNTGRKTATRIGSTASDEMCNFYMMYYRNASSDIETPEICADQYTYESLYDSFPNDSDVALPSGPGHHHHHSHGHPSNGEEENENEASDFDSNAKETGTSEGSLKENPTTFATDKSVTTPNPWLQSSNEDHILHDGETTVGHDVTDDDVTDNDDVTNSDDVTTGDDVATNDDVTAGDNVIANVNSVQDNRPTVQTTNDHQARESIAGDPTQETPRMKTSRSVTHDVTSDITTSTSVSEQTTRPSDRVQDKSTRLGLSTKGGFESPRTTRSTEESQSIQTPLDSDRYEQQSETFNVSFVVAWPSTVTEGLGQVTGLAVDAAGRLFVFHRSEQTWEYDTFNMDNTFRNPQSRGPIRGPTIFILDGGSGEVLEKHGRNMFYMPHGLTIDHQDNLWITDVGLHQVVKFPPGEFKKPSLVLGERLVPGSDYKHFCKPTDVAVEKSGVFYVSDGYCNGRIMKFSREGNLIKVWGRPSLGQGLLPNTFSIPHSLTLDEKRDMLYVADRENGRIQCFDSDGKFHKEITSPKFGGLVFAVDFNEPNPFNSVGTYVPLHDDVLFAVNSGRRTQVQGFTINPKTGKIISSWSPRGKGFSQPHAIVSNGSSIYVAEIGPNRVWKFEHPTPAPSKEPNFARGLNAAVLEPKPTDMDNTLADSHDNSGKTPEANSRPGMIILGILSVPVLILLVVGVVSKVKRRNQKLPKYDMMDASLGNYSVPRNWCNSINCCNRQYRNMEELYLMDSDSDMEIYPDVHVGKK